MDPDGVGARSAGKWIAITVVTWPFWHIAIMNLTAYPLSWLASLTPAATTEPTAPGGLYGGVTQVLMLAVFGFVTGLLGAYLLRLLGAPRVIWVPATIVSALLYLAQAVFWAGFSGSGTGAAHVAGQFAVTAALIAAVGVGARLGTRMGLPARRVA